MKTRKTWILIADGARARVVRYEGPVEGLVPALDKDFVSVHSATRELGSDKPGRGQGGASGSRQVFEDRVDWHTYEKHLFAVALAGELEHAQDRGAFDDLVLIAPPKALGELRMALSKKVKDCVSAELDKDLTHVPVHELKDHLKDVVRFA